MIEMTEQFATFHGYKIFRCSTVIGKKGQPIRVHLRKRNGGKFDKRVTLYVNGRPRHFTLSNLIIECFQGPMFGYQANHKDRDTMNCAEYNLERLTPSDNQLHWRADEKQRGKYV